MWFNCLEATKPLRGGSLLFTTKFPEIPATDLIDLGRMKGLEPWSHPWFLNLRPLDCEFIALKVTSTKKR